MGKREKDYSIIDSELFNEILEVLEKVRPKVHRYYNDRVKAPSSEIRLALQRVKVLSQAMRNEVSELKKLSKEELKSLPQSEIDMMSINEIEKVLEKNKNKNK